VIEPVLMAPLRRRWAAVREQAEKLAERRDAATGSQATKLDNALSGLLSHFAEEIASVRVLDPACGSGNFPSVSMQQLLIRSERSSPLLPKWDCRPSFPKWGRSSYHEGEGKRHHDHIHLKKRVSFS